MRILQVVTFISPDGAYGGPVRVAINQAKALTALGHEVVVAAASGGFDGPLPTEFDGFPVRLFPARQLVPRIGFAGLSSPGLFNWMTQAIRGFDVIHVHLARDLVALPAAALALSARKPLIAQTHGMIDRSDKRLTIPLDRVLTRPILKRASLTLFLTLREHEELVDIGGDKLKLAHLPNGVVIPQRTAIEQNIGPQSSPEILFLARLHRRKRALTFARTAKALETSFPRARFALVGPDEGDGELVRETINERNSGGRIRWTGSISPTDTLDRMSKASLYVLPSIDEPFPMSVLEAMSLGIPVVVTESCGLAETIARNHAGIVCDHSQEAFTKAVKTLLLNPDQRISMGVNGRAAVRAEYGMSRVASQLASFYETAVNNRRYQK
ncbi:GDP-mannose-dependent alpha-(1-6)-phosphatidylinositol monomannoside mannosyltransferase [Kocuria rosea]|uniref:glycosyltransferase n=1 Tax=Kocuria rosea TaxID=1275 RepID=UPI000F6DA326|nr:glycosyltransferase [Kocuria rosea]VEH42521.1 GDP-mannose-dependent alpha-(1-6)-phosphatidylinositol monomannoside mannosyltransferase [Kocuria rosea]